MKEVIEREAILRKVVYTQTKIDSDSQVKF